MQDQAFFTSKWFNPDYLFSLMQSFFQSVSSIQIGSGYGWIHGFQTILFFLTLFFLIIMSYCAVRMFEIRKKEHAHLHHEIVEYAHHQREREKKLRDRQEATGNPRWARTLGYLSSDHASDWRLAIIEADAMLEDLLNQMGFKGESLGDKLKSATQETFRGLSSAWEVHTIRNRIAHEGAAYEVSKPEARRIISIYEQIFRGYGFI